jgi:hypothetical protein
MVLCNYSLHKEMGLVNAFNDLYIGAPDGSDQEVVVEPPADTVEVFTKNVPREAKNFSMVCDEQGWPLGSCRSYAIC